MELVLTQVERIMEQKNDAQQALVEAKVRPLTTVEGAGLREVKIMYFLWTCVEIS